MSRSQLCWQLVSGSGDGAEREGDGEGDHCFSSPAGFQA